MYLESDERLVEVRPSGRQLAQQEMGFYAFFHFGMDTFTDREWGEGTEKPEWFCPSPGGSGSAEEKGGEDQEKGPGGGDTDRRAVCGTCGELQAADKEAGDFRVDTDQWVEAAASAGMKGVILTCKHHDGFCLWPSAYTDHSVAHSPYLGGKGDIVAQTAESCRKYGLKFGVYLSPWDRHEKSYGSGSAYDDYYVNQLTELLTNYGEIFCVWLDGACGEGPDGRVQNYDWDRYFATVRRLQPGACISVCGPDVRWCGNEAGDTREAEWSVVSARLADPEATAGRSQKADNESFRLQPISRKDQDLGSRERLAGEAELIWYPAEVDMSIRPGWFYHKNEDDKVCTLERLKSIWLKSVGGNAMLLLNIPPDTAGRIAEQDRKVLRELGDFIREAFRVDLSREAELVLRTARGEEPAGGLNGEGGWFATEHGATEAEFVLHWREPRLLRYVVLEEYLPLGQRVESFVVEDGARGVLARGTVIGQKRIVPLPDNTVSDELTVRITDARVSIALKTLKVY